MNQFQVYFKLGIEHLLNLNGLDHVFFLIALCAVYLLRDWKKVLLLVTAFLVGHSITLAFATLQLVKINGALINFLIPVTIAVTSFYTILNPKPSNGKGLQAHYLFALFFGFIHGLGFSSYLKSFLIREKSIFEPLVAFNLGLGVGELVIAGFFLLCSSLLVGLFGTSRKEWTLVISAIIFGMSLMMMAEARYW